MQNLQINNFSITMPTWYQYVLITLLCFFVSAIIILSIDYLSKKRKIDYDRDFTLPLLIYFGIYSLLWLCFYNIIFTTIVLAFHALVLMGWSIYKLYDKLLK